MQTWVALVAEHLHEAFGVNARLLHQLLEVSRCIDIVDIYERISSDNYP